MIFPVPDMLHRQRLHNFLTNFSIKKLKKQLKMEFRKIQKTRENILWSTYKSYYTSCHLVGWIFESRQFAIIFNNKMKFVRDAKRVVIFADEK